MRPDLDEHRQVIRSGVKLDSDAAVERDPLRSELYSKLLRERGDHHRFDLALLAAVAWRHFQRLNGLDVVGHKAEPMAPRQSRNARLASERGDPGLRF